MQGKENIQREREREREREIAEMELNAGSNVDWCRLSLH